MRLHGPESEADPAALLVQLLVAFGNAAGRRAHHRVGADLHYTNLFVGLVAPTSRGRKGASWSPIREIFRSLDEKWTQDRIRSGLSTGEGLIAQVRDPVARHDPVKESGRVTGYDEVISDQGEKDKRLLAVEPELASLLRVMGRDGNTLSAVIRQCWDSGTLRTLTRNSPLQATGAHVSLVGHVTAGELQRYLTRTEVGNGFANRFLWICVKQSKHLPEGGTVDCKALAPLLENLRDAVSHAQVVDQLRRDDECKRLWSDVYHRLADGHPGMMGAITSRAAAQVTRLSVIYALLDQSEIVAVPHLNAALAVWKRVEDSCRFIFSDSLGDPLADRITSLLEGSPTGATRDEIRNHLSRNISSRDIGRALSVLLESDLAFSVEQETGGRPAERWFHKRFAKYAENAENAEGAENRSTSDSK